ncbi:SDR family NAD(P)-dependent oxidoreductase [Ornithinibacillus salinisoli]|uniref:SDR family NAD(P)-dependent oxidoreductase n=1 Tax=Ornithinibacillus salinisoli TaxID=1848459 RepID=A0ABW4W5B9_9BACI
MESNDVKAIVTGGASGLGEATVRKLIDGGGMVAIVDRNETRAKQLLTDLGESDRVFFVQADVTNAMQVEEMARKVYERFGSINVLINCAGIATPGKVLSHKGTMDLAAFERVIQVNLIGTFNVLRVVSSFMKENTTNGQEERGVIINTSSVAAYEGQIGQAAYSASKGAVASMTLPIAREFASIGVRVMAIAPGLFETPMFDTLPEAAKNHLGSSVPFPNRLGYPSEYATLVESILHNPMLNGEVIRLDGAIRMQPK